MDIGLVKRVLRALGHSESSEQTKRCVEKIKEDMIKEGRKLPTVKKRD